MKLYHFWESIQDAPEDVATIMEDLQHLSSLLSDIGFSKSDMAPSVAVGLECCKSKIGVRTPFSTCLYR